MQSLRPIVIALAAVALTFAAALSGCSKDKGTNSMPVTEAFSSGPMGAGTSFKHIFTNANPTTGWCYFCTIHSSGCGISMSGVVKVDDASSVDSMVVLVGGATNVFNPPTTTIKTGGYVRWVDSGGGHNVTRQ